eukprot:3932579-Rhodomonas_salina.1
MPGAALSLPESGDVLQLRRRVTGTPSLSAVSDDRRRMLLASGTHVTVSHAAASCQVPRQPPRGAAAASGRRLGPLDQAQPESGNLRGLKARRDAD